MSSLPIFDVLSELQQAVQQHSVTILQAPPGAGKTTAVPLALLEAGVLGNQQLIMLEPRRLAARSAAARMAEQLGEPVGDTVGYQIRGERKLSQNTRIRVVTEGILTRLLQDDPELSDTALVVFDEFHERSLQADLALALCLQSLSALRDDLKLLIMSATLNTDALSQLLPDAPIISSQGRSFPIEHHYWPARQTSPDRFTLNAHLLTTCQRAWQDNAGNLLVFLPGVGEIKQLQHSLLDLDLPNTLIAPLYGELNKQQQDQAIAAPPKGQRKIVLATNVAETSLTIDGITVVIDSGLMRESQFDPNTGMNRLATQRISRASAEQRSGRAGRLAAGVCYRLWTEAQHKQLVPHHAPEILNSDLAPLLLEAANWGAQDINEFDWLDAPLVGAVAQAKELLLQLGAIQEPLRITAHGQAILRLGVHPRLGHMLISSQALGAVQDACLIAALLAERDPLPRQQRNADMLKRLDALKGRAPRGSNNAAIQTIKQQARELEKKLNQSQVTQAINPAVLLAHAYPDRIAQLRNTKDRRYRLASGKGAVLHGEDSMPNDDYIVIATLDGREREAAIFMAASLREDELFEHFPDWIQTQATVRWDDTTQRVHASEDIRLGALILASQAMDQPDQHLIHQALLQGIRQTGLHCLPWSKEAMNLRHRLRFIQRETKAMPTLTLEVPDTSETNLLKHLEDWLLPHLNKENSLDKLKALDLHAILLSQLSWDTQQQINSLAPTHISVPSGSRISIDYSEDVPVLAVRLQEMFGLATTPCILNGQYPLMIHLLSPAHRPTQITQDLASFWQNTYHDVKKELKIKYKKHYWPDDPLQAQATSKTKKNMHKT